MNKYISKWIEIDQHIREAMTSEHVRKRAKKEAKHAFLYLILSSIWTIVDCVVFLTLTWIWLPIIPSNIISDTCGMITSFSLNVKKNFKNSDHIKTRFVSYIIISITWMALSTSMVYLFIKWLWIPKFFSKLIQLTIMAVPLYIANRSLTFREFSRNIKKPSEKIYQNAKELLEKWQLVVFPTETIYGLWADARNDQAVQDIFKLKWRPQDNPLIVHLWSKDQISTYATVENEIQQTIIDKLMPWPLTLLLKKKPGKISDFACPLEYVWIRLPSNLVAQKFLQVADLPVAAPSANISWKPSPTNAKMVYDNLKNNVPLIIDDWESFAGIESTVMRVVPDEDKKWKLKIQILRPWFLTKEDLEDCFNHEIKVEYTTKNPELSPWMRYKHYSIAGQVRIFNSLSDIEEILPTKKSSEWRTKIWILLTQELIDLNKEKIKELKKGWITIIPRWTKSNLASCAHSLFDHYHNAEKSWINLLFVEKLPEEWIWYWIMNRVNRSAEV